MSILAPPGRLLSCSEWLSLVDAPSPSLTALLREIYRNDRGVILRRLNALREAVFVYQERFGDAPVVVARSPGRINLVGRHVDHRGGFVNPIGIDREVLVVAGSREDRRIEAVDVETRVYPHRLIQLDAILPEEKTGRWLSFIDEVQVAKGEWHNYVSAPLLWLWDQAHLAKTRSTPGLTWSDDPQVKGMNLVISGDIPPSAGLSSSSAIVVVVMLAACALHRISGERALVAEKCGEAEWYVGTRGGSGDHAAELLARSGEVSHIGFFPSSVSYLPFPEGYHVVVSNSRREAHKSAGARSIFNAATATYDFGFALLKRRWPQYAEKLRALRDVNTQNLECDAMEIYRMVRSLPETCMRDDLCRELNADEERAILARRFKDHEDPGEFGYPIRRRILYGISECERSRLCADFLTDGDLERFGELMTISHNGDRVFLHRPGTVDVIKYWDHRVSDGYIARLIDDAASGDPARVRRAAVHRQAGDYGCGCEEIDQLVDVSLGVPGVVGAQISGAGLGGSMMALARCDAVDAVVKAQTRLYYEPRGLEPLITVCSPVAGACVLDPCADSLQFGP